MPKGHRMLSTIDDKAPSGKRRILFTSKSNEDSC